MTRSKHPYASVAEALACTPFAKVRYVRETASTNDDAFKQLGEADASGLTIVADFQTRGAGRKGRSWIAAPGTSLLFTTILPGALPANTLWVVPFWTALAVHAALASRGVITSLRWPNDLLLHGKKVCGILCISRVVGELAWTACGVGLNVHRGAGANEIDPAPAFCEDVAPIDRAQVLAFILLEFNATLAQLATPQHVARRWESAAGLPGARYRLQRDGENAAFDATAVGLADDGSLIVERRGQRERVTLADARALR